MANFNEAFNRFNGIEFNSPENVLHQNKGETGLTFYGIYKKAHPTWRGWDLIDRHIVKNHYSRVKASVSAYHDKELIGYVEDFYRVLYWDSLNLDYIKSQKMAEELFFFYLNIGDKKKVVKFAQSIIGVKVDGVLGSKTIQALNGFDEDVFDKEYDKKEISHYKRLVARYPLRFTRFLKGWINRAKMI